MRDFDENSHGMIFPVGKLTMLAFYENLALGTI